MVKTTEPCNRVIIIDDKNTTLVSKKINILLYHKLLLILLISILQINSAYSFAKIISLIASCGSYSDETIVRIEDQATYDFDGNWDAYKLSNGGNTPDFYSAINGTNYSINSFPGDFQQYDLELNLYLRLSGTYTIAVTSLLNSDVGCPYSITMEDKLLHTSVVLKENAQYSFKATTGDLTNRFILHYTNQQSIISGLTSSGEKYVDLSVTDAGLLISFKNTASSNAAIRVIQTDGKELYFENNISTTSSVAIPLNGINSTIYIVKVVVGNTAFNKKIYY